MHNIHPQLAEDCILLGHFPLCQLLLMDDCQYPWFILVPDRFEIREIYQLEKADRHRLLDESCLLSEFLVEAYAGDKLNLAALGNQVPQLHLHHIVRYATDSAWPAPIWGRQPPRPYNREAIEEIRTLLSSAALPGYVPFVDA
jgi:diadenosine tetraphosphate (Ap4A) HIT family hydrolase